MIVLRATTFLPHNFAVNKVFIWCMVTGGESKSGWIAVDKSPRDTKLMRSIGLEFPINNVSNVQNGFELVEEEEAESEKEMLKTYSLFEWTSFLEGLTQSQKIIIVDIYSIFTFGSIHNLDLDISRFVKKCSVSYFLCIALMEHRGRDRLYKNLRVCTPRLY